MAMPRDNDAVYFTWLLHRESYERTAQVYGVSRGNVYKRVKKIERRIAVNCQCDNWRCHCGFYPKR